MTKELEKEAEDYAREWLFHVKDLELHHKEDDKPEYIRIKEAYLASAEPREKRIAELEEKLANADYQLEGRDIKIKELEHQLTHRNCLDCSNHSSNLRMRTLELEKENAELKDKIEMYDFFYEGNGFKRRGLNNSIQIAEYIKKLELRLSYAKETIEGLMRFCRCFAQHHTEDIRYKEAEQFLSEVEK